jgi:hypothetical protein
MPALATKPAHGQSPDEWSPRSSGIRVSFIRASAFIVTNLARPVERLVAFYNHRGSCEQYIKEGKGAVK